ncbi:MAG: hypothetical protein KatS3mg031_0961 [Chitinophagales bacterium]|nr:MAG: hypothetical protein KatS3mg031_0961 [Chitinophagales bacterium]
MNPDRYIVVLVCILAAFCNSCEKYFDNREVLTSQNHALAECTFLFAAHSALTAVSPEGALLHNNCFMPVSNGNMVSIDFGYPGCEGLMQMPASGKIDVELRADTMILTFKNFLLKGYAPDGTVWLINEGLNNQGNPVYHMLVKDGTLTATREQSGEEYQLKWSCDYYLERVDTGASSLSTDDMYKITGHASGVNQEGRSFEATIEQALQKFVNCRWVGSGISRIRPEGLRTRQLNYGSACSTTANCCDNYAREEDMPWADPTVLMK